METVVWVQWKQVDEGEDDEGKEKVRWATRKLWVGFPYWGFTEFSRSAHFIGFKTGALFYKQVRGLPALEPNCYTQ